MNGERPVNPAAENRPPLVAMTGITKDFSGNRVLDGVHFDLAAGEVHVLAGENGAGKSTLIKILGGIHPDHGGTIRLDGRDVRISSPRDAARRGIAVIHQELSLVPSMSVADNLFLGNEFRRRRFFLDRRRQMREARAVLERMGMDIDPSLPVDVFPVPVRQAVEIAKALAREARVLVMDEPTSALSDDEAKNLFAVIAGLKQRNCGIIYITHKMEEIFAIADRITVLRDGVCIGTSPRNRIDKRELVKQMVGRELDEQIPPRVSSPGRVRLEVKHLTLPGPRGSGNSPVNDVSFSVRGGETVGFAGLQGSGTSELFSAVFGACGEPSRGEVFVDGMPLPRFSIPQAIEKGLALLTNDRARDGYVPGMNIVGNMTMAALPRYSPGHLLRPREEIRAAAEQAARLNIRAAALSMETGFLSGGNIQKTILGKWLLLQPGVFMLDDPTRGIDIGAKHEIYELISRLTEEGTAILLISTEMQELLRLCDRIIVMHRGAVTAGFSRHEATQEKILRAAMGEVF